MDHHLYGLPDLTQLVAGFPATLHGSNHLINVPPPLPPRLYEEMENSSKCRWARQETLTLLEVRSLLHHTFKDSNLKAPLWDQVSRIMRDEHGYNRSGKKCKEKFENLYKYYKKTKECKSGRQDGKNYRFFRQLEALCGESSNQCISKTYTRCTNLVQQKFLNKKISKIPSQSNPMDLDTSSSEKNDTFDHSAATFAWKKEKKGINNDQLKKIENVIESRMRVLMERQDVWMEKMMGNLEYKERFRASKEEEWRKQEATRFDQEYEILAKEKVFNEARDTELIEAVQTLAENEVSSYEIKEGASKMFDRDFELNAYKD